MQGITTNIYPVESRMYLIFTLPSPTSWTLNRPTSPDEYSASAPKGDPEELFQALEMRKHKRKRNTNIFFY